MAVQTLLIPYIPVLGQVESKRSLAEMGVQSLPP